MRSNSTGWWPLLTWSNQESSLSRETSGHPGLCHSQRRSGPDETDQMASKNSTRDNPYVSLMKVAARHPNAMPKLTVRYRTLVFGAAVHAGNIDVFHFFSVALYETREYS